MKGKEQKDTLSGAVNSFRGKVEMASCPHRAYNFMGITDSKKIITKLNKKLQTVICSMKVL